MPKILRVVGRREITVITTVERIDLPDERRIDDRFNRISLSTDDEYAFVGGDCQIFFLNLISPKIIHQMPGCSISYDPEFDFKIDGGPNFVLKGRGIE